MILYFRLQMCLTEPPTTTTAQPTTKITTTGTATTTHTHTHAHARTHARTHPFNGPFCPGLPGWAGTRNVKSIRILLKQETTSGSGISWAICKSAPCSRQITMPAPHHSVFYRPDALPAAQPTASKHWRLKVQLLHACIIHLPVLSTGVASNQTK